MEKGGSNISDFLKNLLLQKLTSPHFNLYKFQNSEKVPLNHEECIEI